MTDDASGTGPAAGSRLHAKGGRRDGAATRRLLLDAAADVLAEQGVRGLTQRTIEDRAGVAHGSATYHLGNRESIMEALLEDGFAREQEQELQVYRDLLSDPSLHGGGQSTLLAAYVDRVMGLLFDDTAMTLRRYELYLYAARHPGLQARLRHWREIVVGEYAARLAGMGFPQPEAGARAILAMTEGLLILQLSVPEEVNRQWATTFVTAVMSQMADVTVPDGASPDPARPRRDESLRRWMTLAFTDPQIAQVMAQWRISPTLPE